MKDVVMQQPSAVMTSATHLGGGVAVTTAGSPTSAAAVNAASAASAATDTSSNGEGILQLADMGTPADVAAEMELLHATNRDMFSWLLFNSENMSAPGGAGSGGLDDPFRMLSGDDIVGSSGLSMSLLSHSSSPLLLSSALPATSTNTAPTTVDSLQNHHHINNNHHQQHIQRSVVAALANSNGLATATAAAGSLQVSVQMGSSNTAADKLAAAAKRRGKKRVNDSPVATVRSTTPTTASAATTTTTTPVTKKQLTGKENLNGTPMSATQEGLLRHLQSANQALSLSKRGQSSGIGGGGGTSSFMDLSSGGLSTPKMERASSSGSDDTLTSIQRKQKLERNRESARECRRRKREHILGVEERCRQLERENMELRGQLKAGKEAMKLEEKEKNRVCEELEQMIQRGASEKELAEKIDNFKEQYSDYGHGRRSALSYHLHQIERLLLPTQVTKMCIWALRQDDSFWQDEEDETSLPVILAKELGLTEEQKKKIQQQRCVHCSRCRCGVLCELRDADFFDVITLKKLQRLDFADLPEPEERAVAARRAQDRSDPEEHDARHGDGQAPEHPHAHTTRKGTLFISFFLIYAFLVVILIYCLFFSTSAVYRVGDQQPGVHALAQQTVAKRVIIILSSPSYPMDTHCMWPARKAERASGKQRRMNCRKITTSSCMLVIIALEHLPHLLSLFFICIENSCGFRSRLVLCFTLFALRF